jgi:hypothetical protein
MLAAIKSRAAGVNNSNAAASESEINTRLLGKFLWPAGNALADFCECKCKWNANHVQHLRLIECTMGCLPSQDVVACKCGECGGEPRPL